jgi:hypothetical protein
MVDHEVAEILAEIKRRVSNAQEKPLAETAGALEKPTPSIANGSGSGVNGFASLQVMARAWDRLPPVVSNRTGTLARLELWLKEKLRTAFRWFTWEQVNFNSATYQTLLEVVESLNRYERYLSELRENIEAQREELKQLSSLTDRIDQLDRQHLALIAQLNARLEGLSHLAKEQHAEMQARLAELASESRVRNEQLTDEQRVCYKQLSLELSESRVLEDRARRELEARIARLETEK